MPTILLVEDNEMNSEVLRRRLERRGYKVLTSVDGEDALVQANAHLPDVTLLDMSLPLLDGWEVARRLRRDPKTERLPVIALTANAAAGDREKALEAGCDEYHTKPGDFTELLGKIQGLIARGAP